MKMGSLVIVAPNILLSLALKLPYKRTRRCNQVVWHITRKKTLLHLPFIRNGTSVSDKHENSYLLRNVLWCMNKKLSDCHSKEPQVMEKFFKWSQCKKFFNGPRHKRQKTHLIEAYQCAINVVQTLRSNLTKEYSEMRNHEGNIAGTELTFSRRNLINLHAKNQWPDLLQYVGKWKGQKIA